MELSYRDSWQEILGLSYKEAKAGKTKLTKKELAAKLDLDLNSLVDRLKFAWAVRTIHHFRNGEQLSFMHPDPETTGIYIPVVDNPAKIKDREPVQPNPLISYKQ